jgi:hypothetical protein
MKSYRHSITSISFVLFMLNAAVLVGQAGGRSSFRFLHFPNSARTNALGGIAISEGSYDGASAVQNPALLQSKWHGFLSFNHQFYFGGIQHGYFNYVHHLSKSNITLHSGFQYVNYGKLIQTDEYEQEYGNFRAGEYAWHLGASKPIYERLTIGANLKLANSVLENYTSFAIAADLGARYHIEEKKISVGLVMANLGSVLSRYNEDSSQKVPYDVRLAITKRMDKAPFSITLTAHHLHRWNLLYENPEADNANLFQPETRDTRWDWLENTARHLQASAEVYIGKSENFIIRLGYNHMRRRDLSVQNFRSIAGMSGGIGFRVKKLKLDYGFGTYHLAGSSHHISLSMLLSSFTKPNALP